jgi:hypothetical protein
MICSGNGCPIRQRGFGTGKEPRPIWVRQSTSQRDISNSVQQTTERFRKGGAEAAARRSRALSSY